MNLTPAAQKFVLHWGEMGQAWGINRTMAQVHALLFVSPGPLDAEEISKLLDVSRSNVSTSLRELITWGVVRRVHIIGDRRDRFEALKDVMETFRVIMAERKRREMDPTIALLENLCARPRPVIIPKQYTLEQLNKMLEFIRMVTIWYGHIDNLSTPSLLRLFKGGTMLAKLFTRGKSRTPWPRARPPRRVPPRVDGAGPEPCLPAVSRVQNGGALLLGGAGGFAAWRWVGRTGSKLSPRSGLRRSGSRSHRILCSFPLVFAAPCVPPAFAPVLRYRTGMPRCRDNGRSTPEAH